MKIFVDSTQIEKIQECKDKLTIHGITTNPNLMKSVKSTKIEFAKEISKAFSELPISIQLRQDTVENMIKEADEISSIAKNIVIKVPITQNGLIVTKTLTNRGIHVNMTLCFSVSQAILAANAGATYISPFIARIEEIGICSKTLLSNIHNAYQQYNYQTKIIAASIRNKDHFENAVVAEADIATMNPELIQTLHEHPLTTKGLKEFDLSEEIEE